jgi:hypothetical protein
MQAKGPSATDREHPGKPVLYKVLLCLSGSTRKKTEPVDLILLAQKASSAYWMVKDFVPSVVESPSESLAITEAECDPLVR